MKEVNTILEMLIESQTQLLEAKVRLKEREAEIDKDLSDCYIAIAALTPKAEVAVEKPQEQTERLPQKGDELVWMCETNGGLEYGETYEVFDRSKDSFLVKDPKNYFHTFHCNNWKKFFRFANEQPNERKPKVSDVLKAIITDDYIEKGKKYNVVKTDSTHLYIKFGSGDDEVIEYNFSVWRKYFRFADELTPEDMNNLHSYLHVNGEAKKPYRIKTRQEMIDGGGMEHEDLSIHRAVSDIAWSKDMDYLQGTELETNNIQYIQSHNPEKCWIISSWMIIENN